MVVSEDGMHAGRQIDWMTCLPKQSWYRPLGITMRCVLPVTTSVPIVLDFIRLELSIAVDPHHHKRVVE